MWLYYLQDFHSRLIFQVRKLRLRELNNWSRVRQLIRGTGRTHP